MGQTACVVIRPVLVDNFASLCNCTTVDRVSDRMTDASSVYFRRFMPSVWSAYRGPTWGFPFLWFQIEPSSLFHSVLWLQWALVISKSKGIAEILRDISSSTYQIWRIEQKINRTTIFHKWILKLDAFWKYFGKKEKLLPRSIFSSLPQYFDTCC